MLESREIKTLLGRRVESQRGVAVTGTDPVRENIQRVLCVDYEGNPVKANTMAPVLADVELALPELLQDRHAWKGMHMDGDEGLSRLWKRFDKDHMIYLHKIDAAEPGTKTIHFHQWPLIVRLLEGRYRMGLGFGGGLQTPPISTMIELPAGSTYEMLHEDAWHFVEPVGSPSWSVAVSGRRWLKPIPVHSHVAIRSLDSIETEEMFQKFMKFFPKK